jgi:hypothetical protein
LATENILRVVELEKTTANVLFLVTSTAPRSDHDPGCFLADLDKFVLVAVFRIHRIHMFLGLPDPDPLVRGMEPDPDPAPDLSIIKQKY